MLNWVNRFSIFTFLDNNDYQTRYHEYECLLGAGVAASTSFSHHLNWNDTLFGKKDWIFGHLNYPSLHSDSVEFPAGFFFVPEVVFILKADRLTIATYVQNPEAIWNELEQTEASIPSSHPKLSQIYARIDQTTYLSNIEKIKWHLQRGDCYEMNFCQEFYADDIQIHPILLYHQLIQTSPNPFAVLYKLNDKYCIGASPERFIKKQGNQIISQPIKGTIGRSKENKALDEQARNSLLNSEKDKSENVMIVDLVRNDLSKIAKEGSVRVEELFGVYPFPQVHHMISTIVAEVDIETNWMNILEACFPMGSMTGAPKKRVMELIDLYEATPRGLFSGTIGYIQPNGDFDFNVVIRSVFYNESKQHLNFKAGGGITIKSDSEQEYQESLLKISAIKKLLTQSE